MPNAPTSAWPWSIAFDGTAGRPQRVDAGVLIAPELSRRPPVAVSRALSMAAQSTGLRATAPGMASETSTSTMPSSVRSVSGAETENVTVPIPVVLVIPLMFWPWPSPAST